MEALLYIRYLWSKYKHIPEQIKIICWPSHFHEDIPQSAVLAMFVPYIRTRGIQEFNNLTNYARSNRVKVL
jgi:hypothetical protein